MQSIHLFLLASEPMNSEVLFNTVTELIWTEERKHAEDGRESPLDFLARAVALSRDTRNEDELLPSHSAADISRWSIIPCEGKENVRVVQVVGVSPIRLHAETKEEKQLQQQTPEKRVEGEFRKCKNRECNNVCGQIDRPRSIYCSRRCQSRGNVSLYTTQSPSVISHIYRSQNRISDKGESKESETDPKRTITTMNNTSLTVLELRSGRQKR